MKRTPPAHQRRRAQILTERALASLERFLHIEAVSGAVLMVAAAVALVWANSAFSESYHHLWHISLSVGLGDLVFDRPLHFWINDALMTVFFLVVGLEIRQEIVPGYDPEPDFFDADGSRRKRGGSSAAAPAPARAPDGERRKRTEREPRETREPRERAPRTRQPSHIAPDGFDFSKPYEQRNPSATGADDAAPKSIGNQKSPRPIAFLLGGLGRKH